MPLLMLPDELLTRVMWHASPVLSALAASCGQIRTLVQQLMRQDAWRHRPCNAAILVRAGVWPGRRVSWESSPRELGAHPVRTRLHCVSSDERLCCTAGEHEVAIWGAGLRRLHTLSPSTDSGVEVLCLCVRGTQLALATNAPDLAVRVWDVAALDTDTCHNAPPATAELRYAWHEHDSLSALGWVGASELVALNSEMDRIRLLDLSASRRGRPSERAQRATLDSHRLTSMFCLLATCDGVAVTCGSDVTLWSADDGAIVFQRNLDSLSATSEASQVEEEDDERPFTLSNVCRHRVASGDLSGIIKLWDVRGMGRRAGTLRVRAGSSRAQRRVRALALRETLLASVTGAAADPVVTVWHLASESIVAHALVPSYGVANNWCVRPLAFFGETLWLIGRDGVLQVWARLCEADDAPSRSSTD